MLCSPDTVKAILNRMGFVSSHNHSESGIWGQIPIKFQNLVFSVQASAIAACNLLPGADVAQWLYLPVIARQDWVAVLDKQGQIQGFLRGDGF